MRVIDDGIVSEFEKNKSSTKEFCTEHANEL